eukprot:TRINITY_DN1248_c1_g1_i1.p1 TRINITY_DN1248_c1_g1~~TRINITY_DN1248_c1_g1_i1.p1  ORF type:complete len:417 (+),score=54.33 TRINITY_DN1248_c1_g1_i1:1351-2601(+)
MLRRALLSQHRWCNQLRASDKWGWGNRRVLEKAVAVTEEFGMNSLRKAVMLHKARQKRKRKPVAMTERKKVAYSSSELWPITVGKSVAYCTNYKEADDLIGHYIFDAEPKPEFVAIKTDRRTPKYEATSRREGEESLLVPQISVLTIATTKVVIVMHISQFQDEWRKGIDKRQDNEDFVRMPFLKRLISSTNITKVTTSVKQISYFLTTTFGFSVGNFVDVSVLSRFMIPEAHCNGVLFQPPDLTLQGLATSALQKAYPFPIRQIMSNWDVLPLSEEQIIFSSNNAFALVLIYKHVASVRAAMQASPYGPWFPAYISINSFIMKFPTTDLYEHYQKGSEFHTTVTQLVQKTFRGYKIHSVWFPCTPQTIGIGLDSQEMVDKLIEDYQLNKSIIVSDSPPEWEDAKEEFRLRLAGSR